jgi:hypothetical protein
VKVSTQQALIYNPRCEEINLNRIPAFDSDDPYGWQAKPLME